MSSERPHLRTNEVGNEYGPWVVLAYAGSKRGKSLWSVKCRCGHEATALGRNLRKGVYPRHKCGLPVCRECGKSSPEVEFKSIGRFGNICVGCRREYETGWRRANRKGLRCQLRQWNERHPENIKRYKQNERERLQSTPYLFLTATLAMKIRNHRHMARSKDNRARQKSRRPELAKVEITAEFLHSLWDRQGGLCAITGMPMAHRFNDLRSVSIDRKDNAGGYTEGNVQLVCRWANLAKGRFSDADIRAVLDEYAIHSQPRSEDVPQNPDNLP